MPIGNELALFKHLISQFFSAGDAMELYDAIKIAVEDYFVHCQIHEHLASKVIPLFHDFLHLLTICVSL